MAFERRAAGRKRKAAESLTRTRALHRIDAAHRGVDLTSAEYLDSRIGRTVARRR